MSTLVKEGWYEDPAGRHEFRWFSAGSPTDLVLDAAVTGRDPISMSEPELFADIALTQQPDSGPLLHIDRGPARMRVVDGFVFNTSPRPQPQVVGSRLPRGFTETMLIVLPWILVPYLFGYLPLWMAFAAAASVSGSAWAIGYAWRGHKSRRHDDLGRQR